MRLRAYAYVTYECNARGASRYQGVSERRSSVFIKLHALSSGYLTTIVQCARHSIFYNNDDQNNVKLKICGIVRRVIHSLHLPIKITYPDLGMQVEFNSQSCQSCIFSSEFWTHFTIFLTCAALGIFPQKSHELYIFICLLICSEIFTRLALITLLFT